MDYLDGFKLSQLRFTFLTTRWNVLCDFLYIEWCLMIYRWMSISEIACLFLVLVDLWMTLVVGLAFSFLFPELWFCFVVANEPNIFYSLMNWSSFIIMLPVSLCKPSFAVVSCGTVIIEIMPFMTTIFYVSIISWFYQDLGLIFFCNLTI